MQVFTQYLVSLEVENPEGSGPATTVVVMTDEGGEAKDKYKRNNLFIYKNTLQNNYKYNYSWYHNW